LLVIEIPYFNACKRLRVSAVPIRLRLASSLAVLTSEQKELGALVIDIGAGTTDYVVYSDGVIKHTGVLSVGGDHLSNDLAYGLKVPLGRAEQLKIDLEKNDRYVLSMATLKKTDDIEKLAKRIRSRLRHN